MYGLAETKKDRPKTFFICKAIGTSYISADGPWFTPAACQDSPTITLHVIAYVKHF